MVDAWCSTWVTKSNTIPAGFRPAYAVFAPCFTFESGAAYVTVGTDGTLSPSNNASRFLFVGKWPCVTQ